MDSSGVWQLQVSPLRGRWGVFHALSVLAFSWPLRAQVSYQGRDLRAQNYHWVLWRDQHPQRTTNKHHGRREEKCAVRHLEVQFSMSTPWSCVVLNTLRRHCLSRALPHPIPRFGSGTRREVMHDGVIIGSVRWIEVTPACRAGG